MVLSPISQQNAKKTPQCFLCMLDDQAYPCHHMQIEGRLVTAYQAQMAGKKLAVVTIDTGTEYVEVYLNAEFSGNLVSELTTRGDILARYPLTLRIYHLPTAAKTRQANGQTRLYYETDDYTLAVLEPNILLNITDLNHAAYCTRQHMLNRLIPSITSPATIRGNLVHYCFKELLKAYDRGTINFATKTPLAALQQYLEQSLELNRIEMALANVSSEVMRAEVTPHLASLACWFERERTTLWNMPIDAQERYDEDHEHSIHTASQVRAETFLLAPEIGLRGRLDLFWQHYGQQRLLELKTGGASGQLPKRDHRWQVLGYHALLTVRHHSHMKKALATLLYSGTADSAQAFGIPSSIREMQRVNQARNILVLSRITGIPSHPPGASRCGKCFLLERCQQVSALLKWQPPEPDSQQLAKPLLEQSKNIIVKSSADQEFFAHYYALLQMEERASEQQQALLWQLSVTERIERGSTITDLAFVDQPMVEKDGWKLVFRCKNTSELREGDEILLSNGDPISGKVVTGTMLSISSEQVTVWTRELIEHPTLIDRYDNDLIHLRTLQNLFRWQQTTAHLRDLVAGRVRPRFIFQAVAPRADFNTEQNLAVERAIHMQDYLLIHGPPGTGKTSVIAEIVKKLVQQGQRVLLAAFTNQAVDTLLKRLEQDGFHDYVRLGHERSVDPSLHPRLLKDLAVVSTSITDTSLDQSIALTTSVSAILHTMPVVASTTATWSSDKYSSSSDDSSRNSRINFDVAILDEAGQLTVPAILGALRLARRFILVGDEKQLPPLVLSKEAAEAGLSRSLFSFLKSLDEQYIQNYPMAMSACVLLRTQYRMNKWIANFSSTVFYDKKLVAHESIANRCLHYTPELKSTQQAKQFITRALEPRYPLVFMDVREEIGASADRPGKQSHAEAQMVRQIVARLLAHGIAEHDIGIIAPYRAQVATIRRCLFSADSAQNWPGLASTTLMSVDTVDRFQGGERAVMLISFATTREPSIESQRYAFLTNPHRLNVALTRAQCKLILIGCVPALEHLPLFSRLIAYCRSMKTVIVPDP